MSSNNSFNIENEQELKNMVINSLPEACRNVGREFFDCLELKSQEAQSSNLNEKQFEEFMNNTAIPKCLSEFNLEECLVKNQNQ
jgi:hypothetical protein